MNTRFAVATHILAFLQLQAGIPASSDLIASSVNTNPSLIRRLLVRLAKAALTTSQMGTGGGALLARSGDTITLLDVYRAVDEDGYVFGIHADPNPACPVGRNIQSVLNAHMETAERVLLAQLDQTTIASLANDITTTEKRKQLATS